MLKITHSTTDEQISRATKAELIDGLTNVSQTDESTWRGAKKYELVHNAVMIRNEIREEKEQADAEAEAERQRTIDAEFYRTENGETRATKLISALRDGFAGRRDEHLKVLTDFQSNIAAAEPHRIASEFDFGRVENVQYCTAVYGELYAVVEWLAGQLDERTQTFAEIVGGLTERRDRLVSDCMCNDYFQHSSTSEISNMEAIQKHRAQQYLGRLFNVAVKSIDDGADKDDDVAAMYCERINDWRMF